MCIRDRDNSGNNNNNNSNQNSGNSTSEIEEGKVPYKEGIYYGTGEGYAGDIELAVVIQDNTIKAVLVTECEDCLLYTSYLPDETISILERFEMSNIRFERTEE